MSKILTNLALAIVLLLGLNSVPSPVLAHQVNSNNGISAYLHIAPYDQPNAGQPTQLHIAFSDRSDNFSLLDCKCRVLLKMHEQTKARYMAKPSLAGATLTSTILATFSSAGDYEISVDGSSRTGKFQAFHLEFPAKVGSAEISNSQKSKPIAKLAFLAALSVLLLVSFTYIMIRRNRNLDT